MKKINLISSLFAITALISCKNDKKTNDNQSKEVVNEEISISDKNKQVKDVSNNTVKEFSWDNISESTFDIGVYPYITPPKGMKVDKNTSRTESYDFHKLEMFNGKSFFDIEGRVDKMGIMMDGNKEWNQYYFDKSIKDYLNSIGAQLIFEGKIPNELVNQKGANVNDRYAYFNNFYVGDIVNSPIRMYALKTPTKRIGIQVYSDVVSAQIGIVESKEFEQTIEKITAEDIINEINSNGFISLHINFDTGKSRIKADSYEIISEITKMLKTNPNLKISIEGHTDNAGDESYNMKLSKNRAKSVLMALVDEGIDESRLKSDGFGQTKPIGDNTTDKGKAKNRRVELRKI
ncbi:OmpA family protein [Kordia algicida OT-1]|uniref:30S ribosomal protein S1 n=1 Tax=Kordia algicida OT-1 TaxID=391587 RepID=A9E444_9FLAO|nr:OmpA family protein [Kordia algicida]EDP95316.1 30S ribosomal protein S1 [Kordia algicida OT-1]